MELTIINGAKLANLTPHSLDVHVGDDIYKICPSGLVARVHQTNANIGYIGGIPISQATYGRVENLPDPMEGTVYIVSALVAQAVAAERTDVLVPGPAIRDEEGNIIGSKGLMRI